MPRILIIANDSELRETLSQALVGEGLSVDHATDGLEALKILTAGPRPDAIVINIMMPNMSGWQFRAKQLAVPELASIPTVILTATGNLAHAVIDADGVLPKPFAPEQVLAALRRHMHDLDSEPKLPALVPEEAPTEAGWRIVPAIRGETLRWSEDESTRWVAISLGQGAETGKVIVEDSTGSRQTFEHYEDALEFCEELRDGRKVNAS